jgi:exopolysaccharide biosynthesis polyprenyl glycosylphosphotransferase
MTPEMAHLLQSPLPGQHESRGEIPAGTRGPGKPGHGGWLVRRMLFGSDLVSIALAWLVAIIQDGRVFGRVPPAEHVQMVVICIVSLPVMLTLAKLYGLYERDVARVDNSTIDDLPGTFHALATGAWIVAALCLFLRLSLSSLRVVILFWLLALVFVTVGRIAIRFVRLRLPGLAQNTIILGAGEIGQLIAEKLTAHPEYQLNLVGFIDTHPFVSRTSPNLPGVIGSFDELGEIIERHGVERMIVAFSNVTHERILELMRLTQWSPWSVRIDVVPRLFENLSPAIDVYHVGGIPLLGVTSARLPRSSLFIKRATDIGLSAPLLLILAPLLCACAVAIKLTSPGPVFFRQKRVGRGGTAFRIWKLRTMFVDAEDRKRELALRNKHARPGGDPRMFKVPNDPRITRVGGFLRRTSLDELPQLLNVLRGEMSLVGPRPLIPEEDSYVESWARRRLYLRPGLTTSTSRPGRGGATSS